MTPIAVTFVEHTPGRRLPNGDPAGEGGTTTYGVAITYDGISRRELPQRFNHPRKAARYADLVEQKERDAA